MLSAHFNKVVNAQWSRTVAKVNKLSAYTGILNELPHEAIDPEDWQLCQRRMAEIIQDHRSLLEQYRQQEAQGNPSSEPPRALKYLEFVMPGLLAMLDHYKEMETLWREGGPSGRSTPVEEEPGAEQGRQDEEGAG